MKQFYFSVEILLMYRHMILKGSVHSHLTMRIALTLFAPANL